jgi:CheY-like chemotaxis protein
MKGRVVLTDDSEPTMTPPRILFVDDDLKLLAAFQRTFRRDFALDTAPGGPEALELLEKHGPYAVLVVDMRMPFMNGIEFLERARAIAPLAVPIMLTGNADKFTQLEAVNRGRVFRFLNKPCGPEVLLSAIQASFYQFELQSRNAGLVDGPSEPET